MEGESGWITEFHRSLEIRLAQLLGYRPNIWRDKDLKGNSEFSDEILIQLPDIALMVSIHSPRYVKSDWCVREVNEFHRIAESNLGVTIGTKSRIFKVIKTPVDLTQHPKVIQGLLGYEFFKLDPDTGKPKEFAKSGLKILCKYAPSAYVVPITINNSWKFFKFGFLPFGLGIRIIFTIHEAISVKNSNSDELTNITEDLITKSIIT
jgi:hypothetical protein